MTDNDQLAERMLAGLRPTVLAYLSGFADEMSELNHSPVFDLLADLAIEAYYRQVCVNDRDVGEWAPIDNVIQCLGDTDDQDIGEIVGEIGDQAGHWAYDLIGKRAEPDVHDAFNAALWRRLDPAALIAKFKRSDAYRQRRLADIEQLWCERLPDGTSRELTFDECAALRIDGSGRFSNNLAPAEHPWDQIMTIDDYLAEGR